jgi:CysZ protein
MIFDAIFDALPQIFTPPFRRVFFKTLGLTLLLLVFVFVGVERLFVHFLVLPSTWLTLSLTVLAGIALVVGFAFAITPVSFIVGGFFFDELAEIVEKEIDPAHPGRAPPFADEMRIALKFAGLALVLNVGALLLLSVPGLNAIVFVFVNGYLLGRGYFELAARRYRKIEDVNRLRRANERQIFVAGLAIAALAAVPIANLLTPLFGAALMVRLHRSFGLQDATPPTRR